MQSPDPSPSPRHVAVIGGGFTGALFALKLSRAQPDWRVSVVEPAAALGRGLAYGAPQPHHLLNVPVSRMDLGLKPAFPQWLRTRHAGMVTLLEQRGNALADAFMPRAFFGDYVSQAMDGAPLEWMDDEAISLSADRQLLLKSGARLTPDLVVLATGNAPPHVPHAARKIAGLDCFLPDPWAKDALVKIAPDAPVLMLGAGLTMVDIFLSLQARGHTGPVTAVSRHGFLPQSHKGGGSWAPFLSTGLTPLAALRLVREQLAKAAEANVPWQRIFDAARPSVAGIWHAWTVPQRGQFLRHLRALWDVHRHRMAPEVARPIHAALEEGRLRVLGGHLTSLELRNDALKAVLRDHHGQDHVISAAVAINCTGPDTRLSASALLTSLQDQGLAQPDALGLGLETRDGAVAGDWLYALGPLTRPDWWEITAVPEINVQIERLIRKLGATDSDERPLANFFSDIGAGI